MSRLPAGESASFFALRVCSKAEKLGRTNMQSIACLSEKETI